MYHRPPPSIDNPPHPPPPHTHTVSQEAIDSLADAINRYEGGLVLVSHDFRLISQVAKEIWVCDEKKVTVWGGDIRGYKQSLVKKMKSGVESAARF